ncbi:MAG TPA: GNAT family N-acetyltransferase [Marmoricola sp.]
MVRVPTLTDGVVTLRAHSEGDIERCLEQCVDPDSIRWTTVPTPYTLEDAKRFVRDAMPGGWASDQEWGFAVEFEGRYGGTVSLRNRGEQRAEIAYGSHPDVRGTGAMERALRLLLAWGFSPEGRELATVVWYANEYNWASRKLAWKVGFSFDGTLRGWLPHRGEMLNGWAGTLLRGESMEPRTEWLAVPRIVGEKVVLRRERPSDRARLIEGANDAETQRWIFRMESPYDAAAADRFFAAREEGMAAGEAIHWVLADAATDALCGVVSIHHIRRPCGEIGYWTHPDARGRGLTTEAVRLMARHAFIDVEDGGLGLERLSLCADVRNPASCAVAEKAGFTRVGVERLGTGTRSGERGDSVAYDLIAADFFDPDRT